MESQAKELAFLTMSQGPTSCVTLAPWQQGGAKTLCNRETGTSPQLPSKFSHQMLQKDCKYAPFCFSSSPRRSRANRKRSSILLKSSESVTKHKRQRKLSRNRIQDQSQEPQRHSPDLMAVLSLGLLLAVLRCSVEGV